MLSSSPLIVAPSSSFSSPSSLSPSLPHATCRVIIGPTDHDFISVCIHRQTTVRELKIEAVKAILTRDSNTPAPTTLLPPSPAPPSDLTDSLDSYMVVKRINSQSQSTYPSSLPFLPQMNPGLLNTSSPFPTLMTTPQYPNVPPSAASYIASLTRPAPPARLAPKAPGATSPPTSEAETPTNRAPLPPSLSFPLSMFGGAGGLVRLEESDLVCGVHDDPAYDLMVEKVTDDVHIRLSFDEESAQRAGRTLSSLPPPVKLEGEEDEEEGDDPPPAVPSHFSFDPPPTVTASVASALTIERAGELSAGLDVCVMSMHGTYLQSPGPGQLRVSCLDRFTTMTLLDSNCADVNSTAYKYLRTEAGEFLTADENGRLYLDDLTPPEGSGGDAGVLRAAHRWTIKKGPCQSFISSTSLYLTITEEGDLLLTPTRYEESCVHICFAVIQGSLRKKTEGGLKGLRRWTPKWFCLSGSTLTYFEVEEDIYDRDNNAAIKKAGKGAEALSGSQYSTAGILSINVYPSPSTRFDVEFVNGRVLQVKAEGEVDRDRWVAALRNGKVGKLMDQKAKAGKKKKERETNVRLREKARRAEEEKEQGGKSPTPSSIFLSATQSKAKGAGTVRAIKEEPHGVRDLHITVTVDEGMGGKGEGAQGLLGSGAVSPVSPMHHSNTPSISATPDLSMYQSRPQSPSPATPGSPSAFQEGGEGEKGALVERRRSLSVG